MISLPSVVSTPYVSFLSIVLRFWASENKPAGGCDSI